MSIKSNFSHVIEPNKFVSPIDLGVYQQGVQYSDQLAKQNLTDISALHNSIFNIPTYGKDKEKLMELDANLKQQLQGLNLSNLGSMETSSQIKNLINSAANNADVAGIAQRYGSYAGELKKKQEAEAKNQQYVSPIIDQAEEYYGSGTYKTDTRFNQSGWVDPEVEKMKGEALKNVPKVKYLGKDGFYHEKYDEGALQSSLMDVYNHPTVQKTMEYNFDKAHKNYDFATQGVKDAQDKLSEAQTLLNMPNATEHDKANAQHYIDTYSPLLQNPGKLGENLKRRMKQDALNQEIQTDIAAQQFDSTEKPNEFRLKSQELQQDLFKERYKLNLAGASSLGLSDNEYQHVLSGGSVTKNGQTYGLAEISKATEDYHAAEAYNKAEQSAMARAKVKSTNLAKIGNPEIKGTEQITLGGITQSKSLWDEFVKKADDKTTKWTDGDKSAIAGAINEYPELFGLDNKQDYGFSGADIKVTTKGGIEINKGILHFNLKAGDFSDFSNAVTKAALEYKNQPSGKPEGKKDIGL